MQGGKLVGGEAGLPGDGLAVQQQLAIGTGTVAQRHLVADNAAAAGRRRGVEPDAAGVGVARRRAEVA